MCACVVEQRRCSQTVCRQLQMTATLHCYEFLTLKRLEEDQELWENLKRDMRSGGTQSMTASGLPTGLWFLCITFYEAGEKFSRFVANQVEKGATEKKSAIFSSPAESLLSAYMNFENLVELRLDSICKYGKEATLPREIFCCPNVRLLSLKCNYLERLPADIGRLSRLETLALTNNKLQNGTIPYCLTFCHRLRVLLLDNNLLDALPGFLDHMDSLRTVHRHGNHNYFKSTFMWYHTDVNDRVLKVEGASETTLSTRGPKSLQFLAAHAVVATKVNFFAGKCLPRSLENFVADAYLEFNVCGRGRCRTACLSTQSGYKVYTFKNPYLGNTCVPFQHWACSPECASAIEVPARLEQVKASCEQDRAYASYVRQVHRSIAANRDEPRTPHAPPPYPSLPSSCILL